MVWNFQGERLALDKHHQSGVVHLHHRLLRRRQIFLFLIIPTQKPRRGVGFSPWFIFLLHTISYRVVRKSVLKAVFKVFWRSCDHLHHRCAEEYAHLQMLINEIFPDALNVVISIQMNPGGTQGKSFSVTNEYAIITYFKGTQVYRKNMQVSKHII